MSRKSQDAIGKEHVREQVAKHLGSHPVFVAPKDHPAEIQELLEKLQKKESGKSSGDCKKNRRAKPRSK